MIGDFDGPLLGDAARPVAQRTRPQAPVLVLGRQTRFLDVQPTVRQAEEHLARDAWTGAVRIDACDYYDGVARPLVPVIGEDGSLALELTGGEARPEEVRGRVNGLMASARQTYDPDRLPPDAQVEPGALEPLGDHASFPRFLDALDRRFNAASTARHVAGRLHNFWHAIT